MNQQRLWNEDSEMVVLVDGRNFVYRHYYTHKDLRTSSGEPTGVLHGCLNGLLYLNRKLGGAPIVFVWDGGGETWRHRLLEKVTEEKKVKNDNISGYGLTGQVTYQEKSSSWMEQQLKRGMDRIAVPRPSKEPLAMIRRPEKMVGYKATRDNLPEEKKEEKKTAQQQIPELMLALDTLGIRNYKVNGLEGDDLIGILATGIYQRKLFKKVAIYSTDKDFYQLMSPSIRVLWGMDRITGELVWVDREKIEIKYKIKLEDWVRYRAITGDKSDNIPSFLEGVGDVTAAKWINRGMDPSQKRFGDLPYLVRKEMEAWRVPKLGMVNWESLWPRLRVNYLCSKILVDGDLVALDNETRDRVDRLMGNLAKKGLMRMDRGMSLEGQRAITEWLVRKELKELYGRREEFKELV